MNKLTAAAAALVLAVTGLVGVVTYTHEGSAELAVPCCKVH